MSPGPGPNSESLSTEAEGFRHWVQDRENFPDTCDGGDPGSPNTPSIWVFGLEPGWPSAVADIPWRHDGARSAALEQYKIELQLTWRFNCQVFKLLAALNRRPPAAFREFAQNVRPFERGSMGYFKGNLFPIPCNRLATWDKSRQATTGFVKKDEYQNWMRETRLPILRHWIEKCKPKIFICSGIGHVADFMGLTDAYPPWSPHIFQVNGHTKKIYFSDSGTVPTIVVPHLSGGPNGLNSDESIEIAASYIRRMLPSVF
ncbi:MAG: hypothetical protein J0H08_06980 [Rhizobiales bacterium]|nr:hypothetical protein [Hyphomicrobiales bacterium]